MMIIAQLFSYRFKAECDAARTKEDLSRTKAISLLDTSNASETDESILRTHKHDYLATVKTIKNLGKVPGYYGQFGFIPKSYQKWSDGSPKIQELIKDFDEKYLQKIIIKGDSVSVVNGKSDKPGRCLQKLKKDHSSCSCLRERVEKHLQECKKISVKDDNGQTSSGVKAADTNKLLQDVRKKLDISNPSGMGNMEFDEENGLRVFIEHLAGCGIIKIEF